MRGTPAPTTRLTTSTRRLLIAVLTCTSALAAASACRSHSTTQHAEHRTSRSTATGSAAPGDAHQPLTAVWTQRTYEPVSPVQVVGNTGVAYGLRANRLYVLGLDPATGRVRWARPASRSAIPNGVGPHIVVLGGRVVFYGPTADGSTAAPMVVVEPVSGRVVGTSQAVRWQDDPQSGPGPFGSLPCASGRYDSSDEQGLICFDTRSSSGQTIVVSAGTGRAVGDELVDPGGRDPEYLERRVGDRVYWRRTLSSFYPGDTSTDWGWSFASFADRNTIVGTLNRPWPGDADDPDTTVDYGVWSTTSGIDRSRGILRWQHVGESLLCNGSLPHPDSTPDTLRCRYRGSVTYHLPSRDAVHSTTTAHSLSVDLERFDPVNGRAIWSLPLGAAVGLVSDEGIGLSDDNHLLVPVGTTARVVDLVHGTARAAAPDELFWCHDRHIVDRGKDLSALAGDLTTVCDATGKPSTGTPVSVPSTFSSSYGALHIVATAAGFTAYR